MLEGHMGKINREPHKTKTQHRRHQLLIPLALVTRGVTLATEDIIASIYQAPAMETCRCQKQRAKMTGTPAQLTHPCTQIIFVITFTTLACSISQTARAIIYRSLHGENHSLCTNIMLHPRMQSLCSHARKGFSCALFILHFSDICTKWARHAISNPCLKYQAAE